MTRLLLLLLLALSLVACPGDGELADDDDTAASDDDDAATDDDDATPPGNQEEVTITTTDGLTLQRPGRRSAASAREVRSARCAEFISLHPVGL